MSVDTLAREGVSMEALLAAKEQRAARQADWLAHYQRPVISLTLVTPGAVKDSIRYRNMMGWRCRPAIRCCGNTAGRRWIARCCGCRPGRKRCGASITPPVKSKPSVPILSIPIRWAACGILTSFARKMAWLAVSQWGEPAPLPAVRRARARLRAQPPS